jgi:UDP-N-acetylmuramoyl-tripeptide--D-alanyl-D-alanine ligase
MILEKLHQLFLASTGVSIDTRKILEQQLFFALKGDNFNGNEYAEQAINEGASYAIVDEEEFALNAQCILVEDVLTCLQGLAAFHRNYLNIPIIAITGSNGKTTTKELLHIVLKQKYHTYATKGNLNNHIGVSLSLLELTKEHELAIIEMGANHQKEIASYCVWAKPNFGLITNIGKAHLEGFGGVEGIIKGKTELYQAVAEIKGLVFYNADDQILTEQSAEITRRFSFAQNANADFKYSLSLIDSLVSIEVNNVEISSNMIGMYNGHNIAAALAIGTFFEVPLPAMKLAIEGYHSDNNRSQLLSYKGMQVILDAYNANPTSMMAALENFIEIKSEKKGVFLGDMFEIGPTSSAEHFAIVNFLRDKKLDFCVFVGKDFLEHRNDQFLFFENVQEAKNWFEQQQLASYKLLIKGSRGMRMESLIKA